jgi:hypothetical protein
MSDRSQDAVPQAPGRTAFSPNPSRQTAELQIRTTLLNHLTHLGTPDTIRVA